MATLTKKKKQRRSTLRISKDKDADYFKQLNSIVDEIFEEATSVFDWSWFKLSQVADVSYEAVSRIGNRETKYPRLRTVLKLAHAVNMDLYVRRMAAAITQKTTKKKAG